MEDRRDAIALVDVAPRARLRVYDRESIILILVIVIFVDVSSVAVCCYSSITLMGIVFSVAAASGETLSRRSYWIQQLFLGDGRRWEVEMCR